MSEPAVDHAKTEGRWLVFSEVAVRAVQLAASLVLARLLVPAEFGLVTTAVVLYEAVALLGQTGIYYTLVHRRHEGDEDEVTGAAFWLNQTVGIAAALIAAGLSFAAARIYGEPLLVPLISCLAGSLVIRPIGYVNTALLAREGRFRRLATIEAVSEVGRAVATVALAVAGFGVWSLVIPAPCSEVVRLILVRLLHPWRPDRKLRIRRWLAVFSYGRYMLGHALVDYLQVKADLVVGGKVLGPHALGIYVRGHRLATLLLDVGASLLNRVTFATLSSLAGDIDRLREVYSKLLRLIAILAVPPTVLLFIEARDTVAVLYGEARWDEAVPLVRLFLPYVLLRSFALPASQVALVLGRARLMFRLQMLMFAPLYASLYFGARHGNPGLVIAMSTVVGGLSIAYIVIASRAARMSARELAATTGPGVSLGIAAAVAGAAAYLLVTAAAPTLAPTLPRLWLQAARLGTVSAAGVLASAWALRRFYVEDHDRLLASFGLHRFRVATS